ncbi:SseB family protein [Methanosphaera sp.]
MASDDNKQLIELMRKDPSTMNINEQELLVRELRSAQLLMPVEITSTSIDFNNKKKVIKEGAPVQFKPVIISDDNGNNHFILFTSEDEMMREGYKGHVMRLNTKDIIDNFKTRRDVSDILINPSSKYSLGLPFNVFMNLYAEDEKLDDYDDLLEIFRKLEPFNKELTVYIREDTPLMYESIDDNVYTDELPLEASLYEDSMDGVIINKIHLPVNTRILFPQGYHGDDTMAEVFLPPYTQLKFIEKEDDTTYLWECVEQTFYED